MNNKPIFEEIPLAQLSPDHCNPRLPKSFQGKNDEEIINYLLLESSLVELMQAIGKNDFFPGEQLLVVKNGKDQYTVIEGNRRLTAVRLLNNPELAKVQTKKVNRVYEDAKFSPTVIPCLVFGSRNDIVKYLGYRHITGIQTWKLLEKARYLSELKEELYPEGDLVSVSRELAKLIGSRMDYVRRLLVGYDIYKYIEDQSFYKIYGLDDTTFHFNYIADSLSHSNITTFLGINFSESEPNKNQSANNIETWTHWLFEKSSNNQTLMKGTSADLTKLNKVIGNDVAFEALKRGDSLTNAFQLTDGLAEIFSGSIQKALEYLERADDVVHRIDKFNNTSVDDLRDIMKLVRKIKSTIDDVNYDID